MVTTLLTAALFVGFQGPPVSGGVRETPLTDSEIRSVFAEKEFRWYDAPQDKVVPILSWPDFDTGWLKKIGDWFNGLGRPFRGWFRWLNGWRIPYVGGMGDLIVIGLALLFLTLLLVGLLELLRRYRPTPLDLSRRPVVHVGAATSIEGLPAGVRIAAGDPWEEALKLRARGDFAGAVIYLFAHQLVCLERLKQIRFVRGKTARQLIRTVTDNTLRNGVEPTLKLFELVYYGHRVPSLDAFESVWVLAEQFERRRLEGRPA